MAKEHNGRYKNTMDCVKQVSDSAPDGGRRGLPGTTGPWFA